MEVEGVPPKTNVSTVLTGDGDNAAHRSVGEGEEENLGFSMWVGCRGSPPTISLRYGVREGSPELAVGGIRGRLGAVVDRWWGRTVEGEKALAQPGAGGDGRRECCGVQREDEESWRRKKRKWARPSSQRLPTRCVRHILAMTL
jgi:hypothetical protein